MTYYKCDIVPCQVSLSTSLSSMNLKNVVLCPKRCQILNDPYRDCILYNNVYKVCCGCSVFIVGALNEPDWGMLLHKLLNLSGVIEDITYRLAAFQTVRRPNAE